MTRRTSDEDRRATTPWWPVGLGSGLITATLLTLGATGALTQPRALTPAATATSSPVATTIATATPAPTEYGNADTRLSQALTAYATPDGAVLGPVEAGRAYRIVARYGLAWLQLRVAGSGLVWVSASDAGIEADLTLPDLAPATPTPTPPHPTVAPTVCARSTIGEYCAFSGKIDDAQRGLSELEATALAGR